METRKPAVASRSPQSAPAGPPPTMAISRIRRPGSGEREGCCQKPSGKYSTENGGGHGGAGAVAQSVSPQTLAERESAQESDENDGEQRVRRPRPRGHQQHEPDDRAENDEAPSSRHGPAGATR